jgi:hypothetical protein
MNEVARDMNRKKSFGTTIVLLTGALFILVILADAASADDVEQRLSQLPTPVQERTREMIRAGVRTEDAVQLVQGMQTNRFQMEQMLEAQAIVLEAQNKGLPPMPVINKALEGMAKQVPPERTLQAMEAVRSRYAFAYGQSSALTPEKKHAERLGNLLAESLAAGFSEQDASRAISRLQEQSATLSTEGLSQLAEACLAMARDMSRLGVSSALTGQVVSGAITNGLSASAIASMHQSLLAQSQNQSAQSLAQGLAQGLQGQTPHGMNSPGQSGTSGSGSSGGVGGPGGAGGGGGSGGPGGGGGGGSGGPGGGNR